MFSSAGYHEAPKKDRSGSRPFQEYSGKNTRNKVWLQANPYLLVPMYIPPRVGFSQLGTIEHPI